MVEQSNGGNGAVDAEASVLLENGEPVAAVVSLRDDDTETGDDNDGESGPPKSDAVAIAEIHAETEIAVTAINADVEQARIEADAERNRNWDAEREALQASITELTDQIAELEQRLSPVLPNPSNPTPQPGAEELAEEAAELALETAVEIETISEPNLTPPSTAENEPQTEHGQSGEEESAAVAVAVAVPARKRRRLI